MDVSASEQAIVYVSSHFCDSVKYMLILIWLQLNSAIVMNVHIMCGEGLCIDAEGGRMHKCWVSKLYLYDLPSNNKHTS